MTARVVVPWLHWEAPAWVWLVVVAALLLICGAIALLLLERMAARADYYAARIDDDDTRRQHALQALVDLSDHDEPGELTAAFTHDDVWRLAVMTMQDEADAIDRWLAAGCPRHATPHAIARL